MVDGNEGNAGTRVWGAAETRLSRRNQSFYISRKYVLRTWRLGLGIDSLLDLVPQMRGYERVAKGRPSRFFSYNLAEARV